MKLCEYCKTGQLKKSRSIFCSKVCATRAKTKPRPPCKRCGETVKGKAATFCSNRCNVLYYATQRESKYTPEMLASFEADRRRGDTIPVMCARYGMTQRQLKWVLSWKGLVNISPPVEKKPKIKRVRPPKPKKERPPPQAKPPQPPKPPKPPKEPRPSRSRRRSPQNKGSESTGPRPYPLEGYRDLYQKVGELRMDYDISISRSLEPAAMVEALNRAWKRLDPEHRGFRLKSTMNIMTDYSRRGHRS